MKTKVNLTIEKETLKKVKIYAEEHKVSVSSMVEEYFEKLVKPEQEIKTSLFEIIDNLEPKTDFPEDFDFKKEYHEAKAKKYGF
ncbi:MAG: hypothetical protein EOO91_15315 [Pedobacter sp.]|nr:MAG: hypothetical protein EOO91_15315 [Pedobacter sp.]